MTLSCLAVFMTQMATTIYLPSLPAVMRELHVSHAYAQLSVSVFVIGAALPVMMWGSAADRYGRRGPMMWSLVLFVASSGSLALVHTPAMLLVLRAVQGVAAGGSAIIARILVRDLWSGDELARRLSVLSIAFIAALGGGQFLGGLIGRYSRWETGFVVLATVGALAIVLTVTVPMQAGRRGPTGVRGIGTYLAVARRSGFLPSACAGGLGFAAIVTLQEVTPFVFTEHFGLSVETYGTIGLLIGLAYFAGAMTVNRIVAKAGMARLMRRGAIVVTGSGVAMFALWAAGSLVDGAALAVFVTLYCATTFGQSMLFPNSMATAVSRVSKSQVAHAVALCGFLQQSMAGLAAAAATLLRPNPAWSTAVAVLGVLAWALAGFGNRGEKPGCSRERLTSGARGV
ncbi:MFS transporter [Streptomyces sp. NBC_01727]|uniref:MFS transporter n=1 Tax=Streptomyces sp. NBC_01727 TaxID=2975924 RepID=UPI002E10C52B|nr:MFS transporter [Streptomyces sp. NBC_01727]